MSNTNSTTQEKHTSGHAFAARRTYWPAFTTTRIFKAPVEKLWSMWTTKEGLEAWYWPEPLVGHVRKLDVRVGGSWEIAAQGLDHTSRGSFTEVVHHKRIGMIVPIDFLPGVEPYDRGDTVEFESVPGGTKMTFTATRMHDDEWQILANGGWGSSLDKLERVLAGGEVPKGFTIERSFKASPEKVWEMWTTAKGLEQWFCPAGHTVKVTKLDVRRGGSFAIEMKSATYTIVNHGTYTLVQPHWELSWAWHFDIFLAPGEKPYDVPIFVSLLKAPGGGTKMTFTQGALATKEFTEGSREGVEHNFGLLAKALGE